MHGLDGTVLESSVPEDARASSPHRFSFQMKSLVGSCLKPVVTNQERPRISSWFNDYNGLESATFFFAAQAPGHAGTSGGSKFGRGGLAGGNGFLWGEHRKTFAVEDLMYSIFLHFFEMFSNWFVFAFSTFYRRQLASGIHQMKGRRRSRRTTNDCHWHPLAAIDCMLIFHVCTCSSTAVQDLSAGVLLQLEVECRSDCPVLVMQRWPCLVPCHVADALQRSGALWGSAETHQPEPAAASKSRSWPLRAGAHGWRGK